MVETIVTVSRLRRLPAAGSARDAGCRGSGCSGLQPIAVPGQSLPRRLAARHATEKESGEGRLAGTPSRGNGNEWLKRMSRFRGSGVCRQPVPPGMPVVGAQVAAYCSVLQFVGQYPRRLAARDATDNEILRGPAGWHALGGNGYEWSKRL